MSLLSKTLAVDKLPSWFPIHHFNPPVLNYKAGPEMVDLQDPKLWVAAGMMVFNPVFWNVVAQNEYRNKTLTKLVGSPLIGCYILAGAIFTLSGIRDSLYLSALKSQPSLLVLDNGLVKAAAVGLFVAGQVFVLSSMWALGITGTYLGDYFGILMTHRVTGFPFNVLQDPMYVGSFMTHLGSALWFQSPAGILLSGWVMLCYTVALQYEGPFTDKIYSARHKKSTTANSSSGTTSSANPATPARTSSRVRSKKSLESLKPASSSDEKHASASTDSDAPARRSASSASGTASAPGTAKRPIGRPRKSAAAAAGETKEVKSETEGEETTVAKTPRKSSASAGTVSRQASARKPRAVKAEDTPARGTRSRSKSRTRRSVKGSDVE